MPLVLLHFPVGVEPAFPEIGVGLTDERLENYGRTELIRKLGGLGVRVGVTRGKGLYGEGGSVNYWEIPNTELPVNLVSACINFTGVGLVYNETSQVLDREGLPEFNDPRFKTHLASLEGNDYGDYSGEVVRAYVFGPGPKNVIYVAGKVSNSEESNGGARLVLGKKINPSGVPEETKIRVSETYVDLTNKSGMSMSEAYCAIDLMPEPVNNGWRIAKVVGGELLLPTDTETVREVRQGQARQLARVACDLTLT